MRAALRFVVFVAAVGAVPATASEPPAAAVAAGEDPKVAEVAKADPMICERVQQIGSLLRAKKVCMRKSQWAEQRRSDRANIDRSQLQSGTKGN